MSKQQALEQSPALASSASKNQLIRDVRPGTIVKRTQMGDTPLKSGRDTVPKQPAMIFGMSKRQTLGTPSRGAILSAT